MAPDCWMKQPPRSASPEIGFPLIPHVLLALGFALGFTNRSRFTMMIG
jgi:hypothetical protein